jgi:hypothetical protein
MVVTPLRRFRNAGKNRLISDTQENLSLLSGSRVVALEG